MGIIKRLRIAGLFAAMALSVGVVGAATITVVADTDPFFQQTAAAPCVIGGQNCINGDFDYTVAGSGGGVPGDPNFDVWSPVYSFIDITDKTGSTSFSMAIDYNQTSTDQLLYEFTMMFCADINCNASTGTKQTFIGSPKVVGTENNGVGFSDYLLHGFDLLDGNGTDQFVKFNAIWTNNDGPDRYFLVPGDAIGPPEIPEPSTMLLMGGGLLGLAYWRRRKDS